MEKSHQTSGLSSSTLQQVTSIDGMSGNVDQTASALNNRVGSADGQCAEIIQSADTVIFQTQHLSEDLSYVQDAIISLGEDGTVVSGKEIYLNGYTSFNGAVTIDYDGKLTLQNARVEGVLSQPVELVTGDTVVQNHSNLFARTDNNVNVFLPCEPEYIGRQVNVMQIGRAHV